MMMPRTLLGVVFTDVLRSSVGAGLYQLEHDYFIRQTPFVIRTAAGGGGTTLTEGVDYNLSGEDMALSAAVGAERGFGCNAMKWIQIINVTYQACALYHSGDYVGDDLDPTDINTIGILPLVADHTMEAWENYRTYSMTTGSGTDKILYGEVAPAHVGKRFRIVKEDTGTKKFTFDGNGKKIGVEGNATTFDLYIQGDWAEFEWNGTLYEVVGTNGPILEYSSTADVAGNTGSMTWGNPAGHTLTPDPGIWIPEYRVLVSYGYSTGARGTWSGATLSTANNSETHKKHSSVHYAEFVAGHAIVSLRKTMHVFSGGPIIQATAAPWYLNIRGFADGYALSAINTIGSEVTTVIRFKRVG